MAANLMIFYYILSVNWIFGLVAFIMGIITNNSTDCGASDVELLLTLNMVYFIVFSIIFEFQHIVIFSIIDKRDKVKMVDFLREEHVP